MNIGVFAMVPTNFRGPTFHAIECKKGRGIILPGGKWEPGETYAEPGEDGYCLICDYKRPGWPEYLAVALLLGAFFLLWWFNVPRPDQLPR